MISQPENITKPEIIYPDSDGQPMADNTIQFSWITKIKTNLDWLFAEDDQVFVAGDLLWYPLEGDNKTRVAPDVMVAFGRPKGERGSYKQWQEENIPPQVVFEILSPGNTQKEMSRKLLFYERYGVEEYYIYDPSDKEVTGLWRQNGGLEPIEEMNQWVSPRLNIRFQLTESDLLLYHPNGDLFSDFTEERNKAIQERQRAEQERQRAEQERQRAEQEAEKAQLEKLKADKLAAKLKELGINPEEI